MKLTIGKNDFQKLLEDVSSVINKKAVLSIIQMAKLSFVEKENSYIMMATGTDLETTIVSAHILDTVEDPKAVCVDISTLLPLLKSMDEQPVELELTDTDMLIVKTTKGSYDIITQNAEDYPAEQTFENSTSYVISNSILKRIVDSSTASATDSLRPVMAGVLMKLQSNNLAIVATDAHVMIVSSFDNIEGQDMEVIIPGNAIRSIKAVVGRFEDMNMKLSDWNVMFTKGTIKYIIRCIDGKYPNYTAVLPDIDTCDVKFAVDSTEFKKTINRLRIVSNNDVILMKPNGMFLELSSKNADTKIQAKEEIASDAIGEIEICFMNSFINKILDLYGKSSITMHMT